MSDAEAADRVLRRWGYFASARREHDRCLIGTYPGGVWTVRGEGATWEEAFAQADRAARERTRGTTWGEWRWEGNRLWLDLTCRHCGTRRWRARLTAPYWEGFTGVRATAAERCALERWECPHARERAPEIDGSGLARPGG